MTDKDPVLLVKKEDEVSEEIPMPSELSERQRRIVRYRMRGLSQRAIAGIEKVSQPMIAKEMKAIRAAFKEQGRNIDQEVVVGESLTLYQELEQKAWELYHKAMAVEKYGDCNKALNTIMSSRDHQVKLLMDLGLVQRAKIEHSHTVSLPPLIEKWKAIDTSEAVSTVIHTQLDDLEEPEPPQLEADYIVETDEEDDADDE